MSFTNTKESGFETLIFNDLLAAGYKAGAGEDYNREHAVDLVKLAEFFAATQPQILEAVNFTTDNPTRREFLARLQGEIAKHGTIHVLRKGFGHQQFSQISMFYGTPTPGNRRAADFYAANIFSQTRQLRYSRDANQLSLDLCLFINGLPVVTFELKNRLTKQTYADAINQYKNDRDARELLFQFGRCAVHFAVDDGQAWMCAELKGKASWFLPFNKGWNDGAGNPPNPNGIATDYLWKEILTPAGLTDILENYAQIVEEPDENNRKKHKQIFPRYHQLDAVRKILADAAESGVGRRYLIQHSAGSGKSNSIAWLAHQLVELKKDDGAIFDAVIVVTDRRILDKQIRDNIKQFAHVSAIVGAANSADDLRRFLTGNKKIIISTVQKFPFILDEIGSEHRGRRFAIIIDEAHSSQGGETMKKMHSSLAGENVAQTDEEETYEDVINRIIESRKLLPNASYFAFTATPKNKTLEMFGEKYQEGAETQFRAFHNYTMKQAIEEGFILDVLKYYTPVSSYYRLTKTIEDDPQFDASRAQKKLRRYVEAHDHAIRVKAEIMIDHFFEKVLAARKIGGKARAMVATTSIAQAIQYKAAFDDYLKKLNSPYQAIVAYSGKQTVGGREVEEADLNNFTSSLIPENFRKDPYRFLIVADKYQTGFDEPLLHTMYVDKVLAGVKAVQTLSRLNRAHPQKRDTFVLDFANGDEIIKAAFEPYYRGTILSAATDPNKLHDLKTDLDSHQIYAWEAVERLVGLYLDGAERDKLDAILDACAAIYKDQLGEDAQVDFKGKAKTFLRTYSFLATVLPYSNAAWEKLSVFLNFLVPKLPAPIEEDLSKGVLETIDMDSYRAEVQAQMAIALPDADGSVEPVPIGKAGRGAEAELDYLSNIVREFNDFFGNIAWNDGDKIAKLIAEDLPPKVAASRAYRNAMQNADKQTARQEHDRVLNEIVVQLVADHTEFFKQFMDNPSFKKWVSDRNFRVTYHP